MENKQNKKKEKANTGADQEIKMSIEESFEYLDDVIEKMEDPEVTLEESFSLYEKGMKVLKEATKAVDEVEKKVRLIDDDGNTEDFE
ncbi:MAG: exodeoxyribonuclease VII small subunit [Lachnospiraceae bacterium]|nr:exodeoxyribonuclease VII small subunit [Lachnospiraceae bacterium]